jgi:hypothetical protein
MAISKTFAKFYNGNEFVTVPSSMFREIRTWGSTGIPKDAIKAGKEIYCAKNTLQRIKENKKYFK